MELVLSRMLRTSPMFWGLWITAGALAQTPTFTASAVVNQASSRPSLSPGVLASIFGQNLTNGNTCATTASPLPTTLCGAQILVGGKASPIFFASPGQINLQIPVDLAPGPTQVVVQVDGRSSAPVTVTLDTYSPGILAGGFRHSNGTPVTAQNPARPGEPLNFLAVGLGPTNPVVPSGTAAPSSSLVVVTTQPVLSVGCQEAAVGFAGLAPGTVGFYQVNFTLPATAPGGTLPFTLTVGGRASNTVELSVSGPAIPVLNAAVNGASFSRTTPAAPGTFLSLFGCNFGTNQTIAIFPATDFQGLSVTFNGILAPLFAVLPSAGQINVVAPNELPETGTVVVQVKTAVGLSGTFNLQMAPGGPGVFPVTDPSRTTRRNAAALFANTAWLAMPSSMAAALRIPSNCAAGDVSPGSICGQPAKAGDILQFYVTGLGKATPGGDPQGTPLATGSVAPASGNPIYVTLLTPTVRIGGVAAQVLFSGLAPGFAGLYQINVQVPGGMPPGDDVPVVVSLPNGTADSTTTIAVAQ